MCRSYANTAPFYIRNFSNYKSWCLWRIPGTNPPWIPKVDYIWVLPHRTASELAVKEKIRANFIIHPELALDSAILKVLSLTNLLKLLCHIFLQTVHPVLWSLIMEPTGICSWPPKFRSTAKEMYHIKEYLENLDKGKGITQNIFSMFVILFPHLWVSFVSVLAHLAMEWMLMAFTLVYVSSLNNQVVCLSFVLYTPNIIYTFSIKEEVSPHHHHVPFRDHSSPTKNQTGPSGSESPGNSQEGTF